MATGGRNVANNRGAERAAPAGNGATDNKALLAKALRTMGERWNDSKEESAKDNFGGTTVSGDNTPYDTRLTAINVYDTKNGPMIVFDFVVVEGDETGEKCQIKHTFDDEGMVYLQRTLRHLGVPVDEIEPEDLSAALPDEIDKLLAEQPGVRINTQVKGQYTNCYADKLIDLGDGQPGEGAAGDPEPAAPARRGRAVPAVAAPVAAVPARGRRGAVAPPPDPEPDPEPGAEGGDEIQPGDSVQWKVGRAAHTGVVKSVNGDNVVVRGDATRKAETVAYDKLQVLADA